MIADRELAVRLIEEPLYVDGGWRAAGGAPLRVTDPACEEPLADVPSATAADVHAALDATRRAQTARYGLSAYIFSRDYETVMGTVDALRFGEIYINRTFGESVHAHHSGYGESGIGGEDGKWGLLRYTQIKTAYHHYGGR